MSPVKTAAFTKVARLRLAIVVIITEFGICELTRGHGMGTSCFDEPPPSLIFVDDIIFHAQDKRSDEEEEV